MKKKKILTMGMCFSLLLCISLSGCGKSGKDSQTEENTQKISTSVPRDEDETQKNAEDITVETSYGELHYPEQWREYVEIEQTNEDNNINVTFSTASNEKSYELFQIVIGSSKGEVVGTITDKDNVQRNVYLNVFDVSQDELEEGDQNRIYAMQEDLNYLIEHLN